MKRVFVFLMVVCCLMVMTACSEKSIKGKWICVDGGKIWNTYFVTGNDGLGWNEVEFTENQMLLQLTNGNYITYGYGIITDGKIQLNEFMNTYVVEFEKKGGKLYVYDGYEETVFERK